MHSFVANIGFIFFKNNRAFSITSRESAFVPMISITPYTLGFIILPR